MWPPGSPAWRRRTRITSSAVPDTTPSWPSVETARASRQSETPAPMPPWMTSGAGTGRRTSSAGAASAGRTPGALPRRERRRQHGRPREQDVVLEVHVEVHGRLELGQAVVEAAERRAGPFGRDEPGGQRPHPLQGGAGGFVLVLHHADRRVDD